jgi:hypothetical protein
MARKYITLLVLSLAMAAASTRGARGAGQYFEIEVVDEQSGRGVPLVELRTDNEIRYFTDSNGVVAFNEPGLMDRDVFFFVSSHGYEFPADGFGSRGKALKVMAGKKETLKIKRLNVAERLYRITGQGIYADSVLLGKMLPTSRPVLNGQVMGQDSVQDVIYRGKIYWFWGDTGKPGYPLGNFSTSGAISDLPDHGGLKPSVGVDLNYFADKTGFVKGMVPIERKGLIWIDALMVEPDDNGKERLLCHYSRVPGLAPALEHGLAMFDDEKEIFVPFVQFPLEAKVFPQGHPLRVKVDGVEYFYFPGPYPAIRVQADLAHIKDLKSYETFTCKDGKRIQREDGKILWRWRTESEPVGQKEQDDLIKAERMAEQEKWWNTKDVETGKRVTVHGGSVYWNEYRKRYVMIFVQAMGTSFLGEIWYAEADKPEGPWGRARKIVTHNDYSFYNPAQHLFFDEEGGRVIYFEGTYTQTFSGNKCPTPRYDYNQIMYRLDLADERLRLTRD